MTSSSPNSAADHNVTTAGVPMCTTAAGTN